MAQNPKEMYHTMKRCVKRKIAQLVTPLAIILANPSISDEQILNEERYRAVRFPDDPNSPEYRRQDEINRFHGLRDMALQMSAFD